VTDVRLSENHRRRSKNRRDEVEIGSPTGVCRLLVTHCRRTDGGVQEAVC
jgi:hypothetical protein